jgi:hypothetical protein
MAVKKAIQMKPLNSDDKNDIVIINLDRPRVLRFGHRALKMMANMTNMNIDTIDNADLDLSEIEKIIFCGILQDSIDHGENLKLEDMEDLLDSVEFHVIIDAMNDALGKSFQRTEKEKN